MNYLMQFLSNKPIVIAIISWATAQIIKTITDIKINKRFDPNILVSSGGMPSSHSSFVTSLATTIGFVSGFDSGEFAICFVVSMVVMYDAAGVRRAAGNQAKVINWLIDEFEKNVPVLDKKLKEILGHSPLEVFAGAILGIVIACVAHFLKI